MKKISVILLTLFFSGYAYAADMGEFGELDLSPSHSTMSLARLPDLFSNDPEVEEWLNTGDLVQVFPPAPKTKKIMHRVLSATKRTCEMTGIGLIALGFYLAKASDFFPETATPPFTLFDNDSCPIPSGLY